MTRSIRSFVEEVRASLREDELAGKAVETRRKVASVVDACGWERRSQQRMIELAAALVEAGIFADPDIGDMGLDDDTFVTFTLDAPVPLGQVFKTEPALAMHLSRYPTVLEAALPHLGKLTCLSGGHQGEKEFPFEGKAVRPDLVFSTQAGPRLVCELERKDPKLESVTQLTLYTRAVTAAMGAPIVGLLITAKPMDVPLARLIGQQLEQLRAEGTDVRWLWYNVEVTLQPPVL